MAISPLGTFNYAGLVPAAWPADATLQLRDVSDNPRRYPRLVGLSPRLEVTGLGPDARRPIPGDDATGGDAVPLVTLALRSADPREAAVAAFSFALDRGFADRSVPEDAWHLVRTECGGLGLSVLRQGRLIAAIGAVSHVRLGLDLRARVVSPEPLGAIDLAPADLPLEMAGGDGDWQSLTPGRWEIGRHSVDVERLFRRGVPGVDEHVTISRVGDLPLDSGIHDVRMTAHEVTAPWRRLLADQG